MEREPLMGHNDTESGPTAPPSDDPPPYEAPKEGASKLPEYSAVTGGYQGQPGGPQGYPGGPQGYPGGPQGYPGSMPPGPGYQYQQHPHMHGYQTQQGCCGQPQRYQQYRTTCCEQPTRGASTQVYVHQAMPTAVRTVVHGVPPDYLGLSIFTLIFCCWPVGIFALIQSLKTRDLVSAGNFDAAMAASRSARLLNRIGIGIGTFLIAATVTAVTVSLITSSKNNDY